MSEMSSVDTVSTPHRGEAYDASEYCFHTVTLTLTLTLQFCKRATWSGTSHWNKCAHEIENVDR